MEAAIKQPRVKERVIIEHRIAAIDVEIERLQNEADDVGNAADELHLLKERLTLAIQLADDRQGKE